MVQRKKGSLPVYTLEIFRTKTSGKPNKADLSPAFFIGKLEKALHSLSFASTPHRHDCYFILFVTRGGGEHIIDGQHFDIKPFSTFFMAPGQVHSWSFNADIEGFFLYFKLDFYSNYVRERHLIKFPMFQAASASSYVQLDASVDENLVVMFSDMVNEYQTKAIGWNEVIQNGLDTLFIRMARYSKMGDAMKGSMTASIQIRNFLALIEAHFKTMKLPNEYATKMYISPKYLNALCKKCVNKTATALIQERVIREAKRYLAYSEMNIKQIARELGFKDFFYFMRSFKKLTGVTPDQYRKSIVHEPSTGCEDTI